jgi:tRNA threonylcarbamoyladenosine biosynthesis protein TsaE
VKPTITFTCKTADDTKALAAVVGAAVHGGDVFAFQSDLGGGKTTFVKGLAKGMGATDTIQSPTFTISQIHKAERGLELHHFDFYRISNDPGIVRTELAETLTMPYTVTCIEWGDSVHDVIPDRRIDVEITTPHEEDRVVAFTIPEAADHIRQALLKYKDQGKTA